MSERNDYFESMKALAREKRTHYGVRTEAFGLRELRLIYKAERVKIDRWDSLPAKVRALYMCEDGVCSVAVRSTLPTEPRLFALTHELKHHYCDQDKLSSGELPCGDYNANELIEVGAEVFAAEFLYPEEEFKAHALAFSSHHWSPEDIVRFKRNCRARISYASLRKRLERLGLTGHGEYRAIQFRNLEEQMFGPPIYKQGWFQRRRQRI
ncbi:MAG TPA: ImmA/IrrE family metallo-endopeptidase [Burkholderiales bacterium]|nr:ImmA/IrrE family metallo-endopeptidase [Burkholderiales bacterium]